MLNSYNFLIVPNFSSWILPFMKYGHKNDLVVRDIYNVVPQDKSQHLTAKLEE